MVFEIIFYNRKLNVELVQKKSIKYCYLTIKSSTQLQIRAHRFFGIDDAKELIEKKSNWLLKNIEKLQTREAIKEQPYFLGQPLEELPQNNLDIFYKEEAQKLLPSLVEHWADNMQLFPSKLSFRKNKTRMGSCSAKDAISLNTLLMRYPKEVIEYVIIHELAHIKHKNHSRAFWGLIEEFCPNYKILDKQLKMF